MCMLDESTYDHDTDIITYSNFYYWQMQTGCLNDDDDKLK